jgi:hypothetical protein
MTAFYYVSLKSEFMTLYEHGRGIYQKHVFTKLSISLANMALTLCIKLYMLNCSTIVISSSAAYVLSKISLICLKLWIPLPRIIQVSEIPDVGPIWYFLEGSIIVSGMKVVKPINVGLGYTYMWLTLRRDASIIKIDDS